MMNQKKVVSIALALTTSVLMAGCAAGPGAAQNTPGQQSAGGQPGSTQHDPADVSFTTAMIPHHRQAVQMAEMVAGRGASAQVTELANAIKAAQQPEIDQMTAMLKAWNAPVPTGGHDMSTMEGMPGTTSSSHADHGSMAGMMTAEQMAGLGKASGAAFDQRFLTLMIAHHQGAVDMAATELRDGANTDAKALAQRITDAQNKEIGQMRGMLAAH
jgi:uncharacterized protein (DUF305 family)